MSPLRIRRARENESTALSAVAIAAKRHWGYADAQIEAWRADLEITAAIISTRPTFVAEDAGRIAGFYSLTNSPGEWGLEHLWVLPEFARQGIGRALLEHAKATAAEGGATIIAIDADPNAEHFYLACGAGRIGVVNAPIQGFSDRIRPQMRLLLQKP